MYKYLYKHKTIFFLQLFILLLNEVVAISCAFVIKNIIDTAAAMDLNKLFGMIKLVILYFIIVFIVGYSRRMIKAKYTKLVMEDIKNDLFNGLFSNKISIFMNNNSAKYISYFNNDLKIIEDDYITNFFNLVSSVYTYIIAIAFMFFLNPVIAISSLILSIFPLFFPYLVTKKVTNLKNSYIEKIEKYNVKIKDFFSGFELIKSYNIVNKIKSNHTKVNSEVENKKYKYNSVNAFIEAFSNILSVFMQFAVMLIAGYLIIKRNLSLGTISAAAQLCGMTVYPIRSIVEGIARMKSTKGINDRITKLMRIEEDKEKGLQIDDFKNTIEFRDVTFSYNNETNVLKNINVKFERGKKYAIVGASGSGKSTLAKLMLGYYENYKGSILVDNYDIKKIKLESLSKVFSVIHQNVFIFEDTLKNNITLFNDYEEEKLNRTIQTVGLKKFIESLNDGIMENIDENGKRLSGGEKQRIAIARAIITGTNVLILDEATANLDNEIACNIERTLINTKEFTCIVITHRLSKELLELYDEILVFKNGELCEQGSYHELINNKQYFYSLCNVLN